MGIHWSHCFSFRVSRKKQDRRGRRNLLGIGHCQDDDQSKPASACRVGCDLPVCPRGGQFHPGCWGAKSKKVVWSHPYLRKKEKSVGLSTVTTCSCRWFGCLPCLSLSSGVPGMTGKPEIEVISSETKRLIKPPLIAGIRRSVSHDLIAKGG
ncbi:hypothetical protein BO78DRAFT_93783 [Aspergillus sclerotiicarbonarius CBS 121057]|uniref:Uncharacterized protein n=1 Tax=Aspergillus sclerotiicarbonarius (strain CBS 121057 / IBT 28362) TaxID=1448318 RepID=A0A319EKR1_ASPSB|nr:hypothetical protein BO78DRAFT_93783 [Aspergillus sclerotiicarbonarius CBS 121057]